MAIAGFSFDMSLEAGKESFAKASNAEWVEEDEEELQMAALLRLPTQKRVNTALIRKASSKINDEGEKRGKVLEQIDVRTLDRFNRERVVKDALATNEQDNYKLLSAIKERFNK